MIFIIVEQKKDYKGFFFPANNNDVKWEEKREVTGQMIECKNLREADLTGFRSVAMH